MASNVRNRKAPGVEHQIGDDIAQIKALSRRVEGAGGIVAPHSGATCVRLDSLKSRQQFKRDGEHGAKIQMRLVSYDVSVRTDRLCSQSGAGRCTT